MFLPLTNSADAGMGGGELCFSSSYNRSGAFGTFRRQEGVGSSKQLAAGDRAPSGLSGVTAQP